MKPVRSEWDGLQNYFHISRVLENLIEPYLHDCQMKWEESVRYNLDSEGAGVGGWKPLSEGTIALREALGYSGGRMLEMRGELRRSWHVMGGFGAGTAYMSLVWSKKQSNPSWFSSPSSIYADPSGDMLRTWTGHDLAALHHKGGSGYNPITKTTFPVPARPLYNEVELARIFEETVEAPLQMLVHEAALNLLGGG